MRTTVELPPELMRAAKARSAESGESLKALLTRAVAAELQAIHGLRSGQARPSRVRLPLFGKATDHAVRVTNADLERALSEADATVQAAAARRPRSSGRHR